MVREISVENIAVIEREVLQLGPGFTVLTGETGAGKSLLVDAIGLALGDRASTSLVRTGARSGTVALVADLRGNEVALALCADLGIELEDSMLYIQRDISAEGRSTCRIGGRSVPVGLLRQIGALLVDLHGQHDHQALLDPGQHLEYLDLWIGEPARALRGAVNERHAQVERLQADLNALRRSEQDREQRKDYLRHQVDEIDRVAPRPGELAELEGQIQRLQNVERLSQACYLARTRLDDEDGSARERLAEALKELESARQLDGALSEVVDLLRGAEAALNEALHSLAVYADALEGDPNALEVAAGRVDRLRRLLRKYGSDEAAVLAHSESASAELAVLEDRDAHLESLGADLVAAESARSAACDALTSVRRDAAIKFEALVEEELRELAMAKAIFQVHVHAQAPDPRGADAVQFNFSANAGEEPRPLDRIASGGEMSRVMLALKVVLAGRAGVPTLIFDEIDAGLSGRAAAVVARKLEGLADHYQVICISHLPQLAGRASTHYRIEKQERAGRTFTQVRSLNGVDRVQEVARLLAGEEVGESALANARELLAGGR